MIPTEYDMPQRNDPNKQMVDTAAAATSVALKKHLKKFGFGHFTIGSYSAFAQNLKRGIQITFNFETPSIKTRLKSVEVLRRTQVKYWKNTKTEYKKLCSFSYVGAGRWDISLGHSVGACSWLSADKGLTWEEAAERIDKILELAEGDATIPKDRVDGILQNVILLDLKDRLKKAGYPDVKFTCKAKEADQPSFLALKADRQYREIVINLQSGKMMLFFGQDSCAESREVPCPSFEDPRFDPEPLLEASIKCIAEMVRLQELWVTFNEERIRTYDKTQAIFAGIWS